MLMLTKRIWHTAAVITGIMALSATAELLLDFDFDNSGAAIDESSPWTQTTTFHSNLNAFGSGSVGLSLGTSLEGNDGGDFATDAFAFGATNDWPVTPLASHSIFFTLSAESGYQLDLDGGTIDLAITQGGGAAAVRPTSLVVRASADGYVNNIYSSALNTLAYSQNTGAVQLADASLASGSFDGLSSVTFRFYFLGDGSGLGPVGFDYSNDTPPPNNLPGYLRLSGSVSVIPEPSAMALLMVGLFSVRFFRRRMASSARP